MNKKVAATVIAIAGFVLFAAGLVLIKVIEEPQGVMLPLPYVMIGVGCGAFGYGMGEKISQRVAKKHPEVAKQAGIEARDERNIAIANRAKAKAYDIMVHVLSALLLSFALMGAEIAQVLLLAFAYLLIICCNVYFLAKYQKEM